MLYRILNTVPLKECLPAWIPVGAEVVPCSPAAEPALPL